MSGLRVSRVCCASLAAFGLGAGCTTTGTNKERIEPTFINVSLAGDLATPEAPLPFTVEPQAWTATVSTLDAEGDAYPFDGDLKVRIRPGRLDMDSWVTLTDGTWTGDVLMHAGFGPTRIWFGDEGDKNADSTREASWATGVSEPISYDLATIAEMQKCDDVDTNNLVGEFSELRVADRQVVVTALGTSGFWVTDLADPTGSYNSLFVYTFNEPRDVALGDQLIQLGGGNNEYLGATQLSWPTYQTAEGVSLTVPDPVPLTSTIACDDAAMEGLEAAVVEIVDGVIPSTFKEGDEDYDTWVEYGQWPITFADGACTIYVSSETTAPDFSPAAHVGETVSVRGLVSQIWSAWIVQLRSEEDLSLSAALPAPPRIPTSKVSPPRPRPNPNPTR